MRRTVERCQGAIRAIRRCGATGRRALGLAAVALLGACATPPEPTLAPNAKLHTEGIPPIPISLVQQAERYTDFRGHGFVDWHPTRREMLVSHRQAGRSTAKLFRISAPMATPEPLTDAAEPVRVASYEPRQDDYLVYARSRGGDEADQIVAKLREGSTPVWYLRAENEGHGFVRKENADFYFYTTVMFVRELLLK